MSKLAVAFWLGLVMVTGFTTFKVKYAVQDIEEELNRVRKHTIAEQQETRVLAAEWTYLTQPERLAELNRRFLQLGPPAAKQLQSRIDDLPLRPLPAPPPDVVIAAHTMPAAPAPVATPAASLPAAVAAAAMPAAVASAAPVPNRALAAAAALLAPTRAVAAPRPPVQLVKAGANPLDALIAQIAEGR
jgi:cell division protein FtsL